MAMLCGGLTGAQDATAEVQNLADQVSLVRHTCFPQDWFHLDHLAFLAPRPTAIASSLDPDPFIGTPPSPRAFCPPLPL